MLNKLLFPSYRVSTNADPLTLDQVVPSTVFDVDATLSASYPGTGTTWANLVTAPADGSAQTAYDFYTGNGSSSTTYPTFTGTAGDPAAYWSSDGNDYFQLKSGVNTAFIRDLHKPSGSDFWVAMAFMMPDSLGSRGMFTTQAANLSDGLRFNILSNESGLLRVRGSTTVDSPVTNGASTIGTNKIIIGSVNKSTNAVTLWDNSGVGTTASMIFSSSTTDATNILRLLAAYSTSNLMDTGTRVYAFAMGNEYLDNTKASAIIAAFGSRHGRSYG